MSNDEAKALIKQRIKETKEISRLSYEDFKYESGDWYDGWARGLKEALEIIRKINKIDKESNRSKKYKKSENKNKKSKAQ
jgi:hypothetical protein